MRVEAVDVGLHLLAAALVDDLAAHDLAGIGHAVARRCERAFHVVHPFAQHHLDHFGALAEHHDLMHLAGVGVAHLDFLGIHACTGPSGRSRTPFRSLVHLNSVGSASAGPGDLTTSTSLAMGSKSARKCTELLSATMRCLRGSTPRWRNISWSAAWHLREASTTRTPGAARLRSSAMLPSVMRKPLNIGPVQVKRPSPRRSTVNSPASGASPWILDKPPRENTAEFPSPAS